VPTGSGRSIFGDFRWLWRTSDTICEGSGLVHLKRRIWFLAAALRSYDALRPLMHAPAGSGLGRLVGHRPEIVGVAIWPYQCVTWDAAKRVARISGHHAIADRMGGIVDVPVGRETELLRLDEIREDLSVILDNPKWFMREGQIAINLFAGETRIYSLSFALFEQDGALSAFIGGLQGRDIEGALDLYRDLTKAAHGLRPRDLLIELFQMLCRALGVRHIFAVSDRERHHRSPYFGAKAREPMSPDYDAIWKDRGGVEVDSIWFELPVARRQRSIEEIPAKKRAMYRRRYEMLERIEEDVIRRCEQARET